MIAAVVSLFLTGFVSLIGQIVLLRELNVAFFGVELIYLIALGVWLLLTALGTITVRRRAFPFPGSDGDPAASVRPFPAPRRRLPPGESPGPRRHPRRLPPLSPSDGGAGHRTRAGRFALGPPVPHRRRALCRERPDIGRRLRDRKRGRLGRGTSGHPLPPVGNPEFPAGLRLQPHRGDSGPVPFPERGELSVTAALPPALRR